MFNIKITAQYLWCKEVWKSQTQIGKCLHSLSQNVNETLHLSYQSAQGKRSEAFIKDSKNKGSFCKSWFKCGHVFHRYRLERCNYNILQGEIQKSFNPSFFRYVDYTFSDFFFLALFASALFRVIQLGMLLFNATSGQQAFCKHAVYDHRGMFFPLISIMFCREQTVKLSLDTLRGSQMMVSSPHLGFDWSIMNIHELLEWWVCLSECDKRTGLMLAGIQCYGHALPSQTATVYGFLNVVEKNIH